MHSRSLVAAVTCAAFLAPLAAGSAAQVPDAGNKTVELATTHAGGGWRAARRTENPQPFGARYAATTETSQPIENSSCEHEEDFGLCRAAVFDNFVLRFAAQSPDYELLAVAPSGPVWSYPPRRQPTSVPVPGFIGEVDAPQRLAVTDRLALLPSPRDPISRNSPSTRRRPSVPASYLNQAPAYDSPPPLPSFHAAPFDRAEPAFPVQPIPSNSCAPCQSDLFDDPCRMVGDDALRYSWDNIYFFAAYETFRLHDEGNRTAIRAGMNWGLPIIDDYSGPGFQIGFSGSLAEEGPQWFFTSGLFYRGDMHNESAGNVGAVFDWMEDHEIGTGLGQVRGMASITLDRKNEIGVWGALSVIDDFDKLGHKAESVDQANLYYRHLFDSAWDVSIWVGWRSPQDSTAIGASWYAPINDYWAGFTGGYYAFVGDTWNMYSGIMRHWGNRARQDYLGQDRHMPFLPVADNTSMTLFHKP